jgi:hypothetical protein
MMKIYSNVTITSVVALAFLGIIACSDDEENVPTKPNNVGAAGITWTLVNSQITPGVDQPADCPGSGNVAVTVIGPTNTSSNGPCSNVPLVVPNLVAGSYDFDLVLTDETNHPGQSAAAFATADIIAGSTADIQVTIDCTFCPANPSVGTASITWTLVNSQITPGVDTPATCPVGGNVEVTITGPTSGGASGPCSNTPLVIPALAAGSYTFDLLLTDETNHPGQSAAAQVSADIIAGSTADIQLTIDCTFCSAQ